MPTVASFPGPDVSDGAWERGNVYCMQYTVELAVMKKPVLSSKQVLRELGISVCVCWHALVVSVMIT